MDAGDDQGINVDLRFERKLFVLSYMYYVITLERKKISI